MTVPTIQEEVSIKAYASKESPTSGRITADYNGTTKEIAAVVFSESEVKRLFDGIDLQPEEGRLNSEHSK
jgi:hypothetical protein